MTRTWKCEKCGKTIKKRWSFYYCHSCAMIKAGYIKYRRKWVLLQKVLRSSDKK